MLSGRSDKVGRRRGGRGRRVPRRVASRKKSDTGTSANQY